MEIKDLTESELMHLHNMVHEIYANIMLGYTTNVKSDHPDKKEAEIQREKGFIACGILLKLIRAVHEYGLCTDENCESLKRAEEVYKNFFKEEHELESWMAKREQSLCNQSSSASPRSQTSVHKIDVKRAND